MNSERKEVKIIRKRDKNMNLNNIKVGDTIKNYKEMCLLLEVPEKNNRKYQFDEWERYFKWSKQGNSFIIEDIYYNPLEKNDGRGKAGVPYIKYIERLILDLLMRDKNSGNVSYSKFALLNILKMVNDNYYYGKSNPKKVSELLEIKESNVNEFFNVSSDTLTTHLKKALDTLQKNALITYNMTKWVCQVKTIIDTNKSGNAKVSLLTTYDQYDNEYVSYNSKNAILIEKRKASEEEVDEIRRAERQVMINMDCTTKQEIVRSGKWVDYKKTVNRMLLDQLNIEYYYDKYDIRFYIDHIEREIHRLDEYDRIDIQELLNNEIIERLERNTENRWDNSKGEKIVENDPFNNVWEQEIPEDMTISDYIKGDYMSEQMKLINKFIDKDHINISKNIKKSKIKKD